MYLPFILSSADAKASDMEKKEAARKAKAAEKIINALENAPNNTLTKTQIEQQAKVYKQTLTDTLADFEKAGVVGKTMEMKDGNGQSYPAYKLNVLPDPQSITAASPLQP
jgi:Fic family protein